MDYLRKLYFNYIFEKNPWAFIHVPNHLKTQEMCEIAVNRNPDALLYVPDHLKTQEMCERAVEQDPWMIEDVPDKYKTQEMCVRAVGKDPDVLQYVPDYFVTEDMLVNGKQELADDYRNRKSLKMLIKEELLPITWHPSRYWNWCMPEDEKREVEKLWSSVHLP